MSPRVRSAWCTKLAPASLCVVVTEDDALVRSLKPLNRPAVCVVVTCPPHALAEFTRCFQPNHIIVDDRCAPSVSRWSAALALIASVRHVPDPERVLRQVRALIEAESR